MAANITPTILVEKPDMPRPFLERDRASLAEFIEGNIVSGMAQCKSISEIALEIATYVASAPENDKVLRARK